MFVFARTIFICIFVLKCTTVFSALSESPVKQDDIHNQIPTLDMDIFHNIVNKQFSIFKQNHTEKKDINVFNDGSKGLTGLIDKIVLQTKDIVKKAVENIEKPFKIAYGEVKEIFYKCVDNDLSSKILATYVEPLKKLADKLNADAQEILHDAPHSVADCFNMLKLEKTPGFGHLSNCSHDDSTLGNVWNLIPKYEEKVAELFKTMNYDFNDFVLPIFENCFTDAYLTARNLDNLPK